jgi:hypothetical protein
VRGAAASLLIVAGLALAGCEQDASETPVERREEEASVLEGVPLREGEVPEGLEPSEEGTGPIGSLREVLPPRSALPNRAPIPGQIALAFRGGFETVYVRGGQEGGGAASAASSAIRFSTEDRAAGFLAYLRDVQVGSTRGPARTEVPVSGVGEEAFGWHTQEPLGESSTVVWRDDDLILTVSVGGSIGSATPERAAALARTVDRRVGGSPS